MPRASEPWQRVLLDVVAAPRLLVLAAGPAAERPGDGVGQRSVAVLAAYDPRRLGWRFGERLCQLGHQNLYQPS